MAAFLANPQISIVLSLYAGCIVAIAVTVFIVLHLRATAQRHDRLHNQTFALMKKVEGFTAPKREEVLRNFDELLERLRTELPHQLTAEVGERIFEAETKILSRLAELEPNLAEDEVARRKMEELIRSMEQLEAKITVTAVDAVISVLRDTRHTLFIEPAHEPLVVPIRSSLG